LALLTGSILAPRSRLRLRLSSPFLFFSFPFLSLLVFVLSPCEPSPPYLRLLRLLIRPRPSKKTPGHPSTLAAHTGQGQRDAGWAAYSDTMPEDSPSISAASTARPQMVPSVKAFQGRQRGYDACYPSPSTFASLILHFDFLSLAYSLWPFCNIHMLPCLHVL
jgi:hypothetical protein